MRGLNHHLRHRAAACLTVVLIAGPISSAQAQVPGQPARCDAPASAFKPGTRRPLNSPHAAAINLIRADFNPDGAKRAAPLLAPLGQLLRETILREGQGSVAAALLKSDVADLIVLAQSPERELMAALRREALPVLEQAGTPEAVEVAIAVSGKVPFQTNPDYNTILDRLRRHRRAVGDQPAAAPLWTAALGKAPSPKVGEQLAREQVDAARRSGQARWLFDARNALLRSVVVERSGRTDPEDNPGALAAVSRSAAAGELAPLSREILSEAKRRLEWTQPDKAAHCDWGSGRADLAARFMIVAGSEPERRDALAFAVRSATDGDPFGTDHYGALNNMAAVLAARSFERGLFLEGLRRAGTSSFNGCKDMPSMIEGCPLVSLANAFVEVGSPGGAVPLFRDALQLATERGADPKIVADLLVQLATVEWQYGTASEAPALLDRAERLLASDPGKDRSVTAIRALRLRASIADAQLDDRRALDAYGRLVTTAIGTSRTLTPDALFFMNGGFGGDASRDEARRAVQTLTRDLLRGRFCSGCAPPGAVPQPALDWLTALFDPGNPKGFTPSPSDYLQLDLLPPSAWTATERRRAQDQFLKSLPNQFGQTGIGAKPAFEEVKRRLPKADLAAQLRVLALSLVVSSGERVSALAAEFMTILLERDVGRKRQLWKAYFTPISENNYGQFGAIKLLYQDLDMLARASMTAGYGLMGQIVFETLLDEMSKGASGGVVANDRGRKELTEQASLSVTALARLAAFSIEKREWDVAQRQLDLAGSIIQVRLGQEWRVANERAAASLAELRGASRLVAQLRARMMKDAAARNAGPDTAARLFADLQLAMLSETALAAQASDRRRVTGDPALAGAIKARDDAIRETAALGQFAVPAERYGLTSVADQTKALDAAKSRAASLISQRLAVSEDLLSPAPLALAQAEQALEADEGLLVLHAGTDNVYAFLKAPGRPPVSWIAPLPLGTLEGRIAEIRRGLSVVGGQLQRFPFLQASEFYNLLLGPAHEALSPIRHLLVVSDGPLQALPLSILLTERPSDLPGAPDEIRGSRLPWLARRHAVTVLTSVRGLATRRTARLASRARFAFAGFGNPVLDGPPGPLRSIDFDRALMPSGTADVAVIRAMRALPDTETEIRRLGQALGGRPQDLAIGPTATEAAVKRMPLSEYRVIAFATHGVVAGKVTGANEPGLVLTPPRAASAEDDGYLSASEIAALKLDADLVILSACNTASSDGRPRAEGLSGLSRAFLAAGARSVLATHWEIPSAPTIDLTARILEKSREGQSDWGRLLQQAMLAVIDEIGPVDYAHPTNWGAFIAIGTPSRIR